ncbi:MAG: SDR family oxidoreductase [Chloroflexi bacterium]|nr:SDR family oxidoreductase [Chloroflexota bacterium]
MQNFPNLFDLTGRVAVITGGTGSLGLQHASAIAGAGGIPVLADIRQLPGDVMRERFGPDAISLVGDITKSDEVSALLDVVLKKFGRVDILINNAANNPKVEGPSALEKSRFETFSLDQWHADLAVSLTGSFLCSQVFGAEMARRKGGVIVNLASDLAVIAPDQRIYRKGGVAPDQQPVKPVTYSVVKTAILGLTRYLATYWAEAGVRVNAISPGGVFNGQPDEFVARLSQLIPMGRMAHLNEYQGAILFLCSDASSYMTGSNLIIDGGRSCW